MKKHLGKDKGKDKVFTFIRPGSLQSTIDLIKTKKTGGSSQCPKLVENSQPQIEIIPTQDYHITDPTRDAQSADWGTEADNEASTTETDLPSSASIRRRRGCNRNLELNKLTQGGQKVLIQFDPIEKKAIGDNKHLWVGHIGTIVKENSIIPHCTLTWSKLAPASLDNLWQAMIDKFYSEDDIELYREATLVHMNARWDDWRHRNNKKHVKPHNDNFQAALTDCPLGMDKANWEWLLKNYYLTENYKKTSATNTKNKEKMQYPHRTGSKGFPQLRCGMEKDTGGPIPFEEFFLHTRKHRKTSNVDPLVQEKYDKMIELKQEHPSMLDIDLIERVFGAQTHGTVIGMGSILASTLKRSNSKQQLRAENIDLQNRLKAIEAAI